jgi:hypothetical protein
VKRGPRGFPICRGCNAESIGPAARWCSGCWTPDRDPIGAAYARRLGLLPPLELTGEQLALTP